jgi:hypothetical protein
MLNTNTNTNPETVSFFQRRPDRAELKCKANRDDLIRALVATAANCDDDTGDIDVRLYLRPWDNFDLCTGLSDYDTDHRGWCGAASVWEGMDDDDAASVADEIIEQILDAVWTEARAVAGPLDREIDVTAIVEDEDCSLLSASAMELGPNAGRITWQNCTDHFAPSEGTNPLLVPAVHCDEIVDYFLEYGAWSREELEAHSVEELNALVLQEVAATVREIESFDSYEEYEAAAREGSASGRVYRGDNGRWYFYLGM